MWHFEIFQTSEKFHFFAHVKLFKYLQNQILLNDYCFILSFDICLMLYSANRESFDNRKQIVSSNYLLVKCNMGLGKFHYKQYNNGVSYLDRGFHIEPVKNWLYFCWRLKLYVRFWCFSVILSIIIMII